MNIISKIGIIIATSCITLSAVAQKPIKPLEIAHKSPCLKFSPVNGEFYKWVKKDVYITSQFLAQAASAGYNSYIPNSYINQKNSQYCSSYIDPAGFPHHISKARSCQLVAYQAPPLGGYIAKLKYSGCYLQSSKRHLNRLTATAVMKIL